MPLSSSVPSVTSKPFTDTVPPIQPTNKAVTFENQSKMFEIPGVGRIYPWSHCVWHPTNYQGHASTPMDFLLWSSHNNLAETYFSKASRMGLLILDQNVLQSHHPWHMQRESAKPLSYFDQTCGTTIMSVMGHTDDGDEDEEEENKEDALFCGKQLYPTRYFVSHTADSSSPPLLNGHETTHPGVPMVPNRLMDWNHSQGCHSNGSNTYMAEQGWNEYDEWYARTYHQYVGGSTTSLSRISDERMDFPYLRLNRIPMRSDGSKDTASLYKELDPFKTQPYAIQSKRIASTMYTSSAVSGCTISPGTTNLDSFFFFCLLSYIEFVHHIIHVVVQDLICLSAEHGVYICDLGLTNVQCDLILHTAERCANGTYAAYTYAKQTLGCRDYDALALVCEWPVLKVCSTINKYLENPIVEGAASGNPTSSSMARKRILSLDDREPHIGTKNVNKWIVF